MTSTSSMLRYHRHRHRRQLQLEPSPLPHRQRPVRCPPPETAPCLSPPTLMRAKTRLSVPLPPRIRPHPPLSSAAVAVPSVFLSISMTSKQRRTDRGSEDMKMM